jgi:hypothetical protein
VREEWSVQPPTNAIGCSPGHDAQTGLNKHKRSCHGWAELMLNFPETMPMCISANWIEWDRNDYLTKLVKDKRTDTNIMVRGQKWKSIRPKIFGGDSMTSRSKGFGPDQSWWPQSGKVKSWIFDFAHRDFGRVHKMIDFMCLFHIDDHVVNVLVSSRLSHLIEYDELCRYP